MKKITASFFLTLIIITLAACKGKEPDGTMKIKYNEFHQEIDGFGGSDAWLWMPRNPDTAEKLVKLLFSKTEGVGFTILRNRIPFRERLSEDESPGVNDGFVVRKGDNTYDYTINPDGTKTFRLNWNGWDQTNTKELIKRIKALGEDGPEQLVIMSTPWTTPNNRVTRWKEDVIGVSANLNYTIDWSRPDLWGRLRRDKYEDYADLLADYVLNYEKEMGAPFAILSVQNEPNWKVEYESTYWNGEDIRDFLKVIGKRFPMKGIKLGEGGIGIMAPEYENFDVNFNSMIKPYLDDPEAEKVLTHIGLHQYNAPHDSSRRSGAKPFPEINASGKKFWQTEVSGSGPNLPAGNGIENAMFYARMIHFDFTLSQVNAYLYWWLWGTDGDKENFPGTLVMVNHDEIITPLRLYAMGQYSRFIRPGWFRIECDTSPVRGKNIYASTYRNPKTKEIAIVIINDTITPISISLDLDEGEFDKLDIWRTSSNERLAFIGSQKTSRNTSAVNIAPMSITTFYGTLK